MKLVTKIYISQNDINLCNTCSKRLCSSCEKYRQVKCKQIKMKLDKLWNENNKTNNYPD